MMENKNLLTQNSIFSETILQKFKKTNIFIDLKKAERIQHTSIPAMQAILKEVLYTEEKYFRK